VSIESSQIFAGHTGTNCGTVRVGFEIQGGRAELVVDARLMGSPHLRVRFGGDVERLGSHYAVVALRTVRNETDVDAPCCLPPSDGPLLLECVVIPPQSADVAGSEIMNIVGSWTERFDCLVWIHADADYDDGTELDPEDYDPPVSHFAAAVEALRWLGRPFKLASAAAGDDA